MTRYITIPVAAIGAIVLAVHLAQKITGLGTLNATDAMGILVFAGVVHLLGTKQ